MLQNFNAYQIAKKIHLSCKTLKVSRLLRDQLLRASSSIVLNTAEGSGKRTLPDQRRFYSNALGSLRECQAILDLEEVQDKQLLQSMDDLGAILYTLTLDKNIRKQPRKQTQNSNGNRNSDSNSNRGSTEN
jgi:four helix bundle protein